MRGPRDERIGGMGMGIVEAVEPDGGKVLERLHLFNIERGFERDEAPANAPARALASALATAAAPDIAEEYGAAARMLAQATLEGMGLRRFDGEGAVGLAAAAVDRPEAALAAAPPLPSWRPIGPTRMDNGQTYGDTRISVSGRVSSVAVDPGNRNHILCGSAAGGLWRSLDGGTSWSPRTEFAPTLTIGAVAFDPSAPATVYVGTGEGNFYARLGQGVLRSTDGGASFALLAGAPFVGAGFYDLLVDPGNRQRLIAATTNGLWVSADGGANWTRRRTARTWDLSIHPAGGAAAEILAACADGLFRSTDGTSWTAVALPGGIAGYNRMGVSHARTDPTVAYVFASGGGQGRLWRRAGGAWIALPPPADLGVGQDWYDWFVAAAPDRVDQVYIGAIEAWRGDRSGQTWTWTKISNKAGQDIHPDQHAIAFDPVDPNVVLIGNDGGLFRSPDRGQNWRSLNDGLAITEIEYIAQDYGSARWLVGGTQDNGSVRYQGSGVWDHIADGDGGDCGINRAAPATVFHTYYSMGMERSTTRGDFGSFSWVGPNVPDGYNALFYPPMEVNGTVVAQAGASVFVSRDSGGNWTEVALPGVVASALDLPSPDLLFVGTTGGRLFRIRWSGTAWGAAQELTSPRAAWISDVLASADGNRIWATSSQIGGGRAFISTDAGVRWTDRTAGLPNIPVNAVQVDPQNANRVWVAADLGVFQTLNGGLTWAVFGTGLPNVLVADLLFHPHARLLRAGTRNRGVWEIKVDGEMTQPICGTQFTGTLPASGTNRWFTFNWPATWHVVWTVMPTTVQVGAPQVRWTVQVERASVEYVTYWISVTNLTGQPVAFEGRFAILSRS